MARGAECHSALDAEIAICPQKENLPVILFKACPRCGGDVDATYADDVRCVQCSHRPDVTYPGPRIIQKAGGEAPNDQAEARVAAPATPTADAAAGRVDQEDGSSCPRCGSTEHVRLDKLRERDHSCYRCRACGHIFSPSAGDAGKRQRSTIP